MNFLPRSSRVSIVISLYFEACQYGRGALVINYYPQNPFERYTDDEVVHCKTEAEANRLKAGIAERLRKCKLELHPEKTKIVYCKDGKRKKKYLHEKFDFLGYTFRARKARDSKGEYFTNFTPAVSNKAKKKMSSTIRSWKMHMQSGRTLTELSKEFNSVMRGWINYYGKYYKSELYAIFGRVNCTLARWAAKKYKKLRGHYRRARKWLRGIAERETKLFAHWQMGVLPAGGIIRAV